MERSRARTSSAPTVDGDCYGQDGVPLYALEGCSALSAGDSSNGMPDLGQCKGSGVLAMMSSPELTSTSYNTWSEDCNHYDGKWSCHRIVMSYEGAAKNIKVGVQPDDAREKRKEWTHC